MNAILCFLCLSLIGWICLFIGLAQSRRFRARVEVETDRAEGIIQGYEGEEKPWGRGPTAKCYHPVVCFTVDGHPYTATADFYYLEMRGQDPKRPPDGSSVVLYSTLPTRSGSTLNRRRMIEVWSRIGIYCIILAAVVSAVYVLVLKW